MKYCTHCGEKIVEGNKFCGNCGERVNGQVNKKENRADQSAIEEKISYKKPFWIAFALALGSSSLKIPSINGFFINLFVMFFVLFLIFILAHKASQKNGIKVAIILLIIFSFCAYLFNIAMDNALLDNPGQDNSVAYQLTAYPTRTKMNTKTPTPVRKTKTPTPRPTERVVENNLWDYCHEWDEIDLDDIGSYKCVYGNIYASYLIGENLARTTFSQNNRAFTFIVKENIIFDTKQCVWSSGKIEEIDGGPVMYVYADNVYLCPDD